MKQFKNRLVQGVERRWYRASPGLLWLLWPLEWLYRIVICVRRFGYLSGIFRIHYGHVPVWVIGNLTVGGTGKTPFVIWLAQKLEAAGLSVAVVTRGYASHSNASDIQLLPSNRAEADALYRTRQVSNGTSLSAPCHSSYDCLSKRIGDEAALLAQALPRSNLAIGKQRRKAIEALEALLPRADIILSDDGLSHFSMGRDKELALIDGRRRYGNGHCLPLGPMREPRTRLRQVDAKIIRGKSEDMAFEIELGVWHPLQESSSPVNPSSLLKEAKTIYLIAGIGHPQQFFDAVEAKYDLAGKRVKSIAFPDHHFYVKGDITQLSPADLILMTQKDAVKCTGFADHRFYAIDAVLQPNQALVEKIDEWIDALKRND